MSQWIALIGPFFFPLLACSLLAAACIAERTLRLLRGVGLPGAGAALRTDPPHTWPQVADRAQQAPPLSRAGLVQLAALRGRPRAAREEVLTLWLGEQRHALLAPLRWLSLIAGIAPMLGLLGTVTGMIRAFAAVADHAGPVTPGLLASGLWEALLTTALGLGIALPATVAVQLFRAWAQQALLQTAGLLNRSNLALEGVPIAGSAAQEAEQFPEGTGASLPARAWREAAE